MRLNKGATEAVVDNYYEQGTTITIPLDPRKTAIENAQRFFTRYSKAKTCFSCDCRATYKKRRKTLSTLK